MSFSLNGITVMTINDKEPNWFYELNGKRHDNVTTSELIELIKTGVLTQESLVWNQSFDNWKAIKDTDLKEYVPQKNTEASPPPMAQNRNSKELTPFVKKLVLIIITFLVLVLVYSVYSANNAQNSEFDDIADTYDSYQDFNNNSYQNVSNNSYQSPRSVYNSNIAQNDLSILAIDMDEVVDMLESSLNDEYLQTHSNRGYIYGSLKITSVSALDRYTFSIGDSFLCEMPGYNACLETYYGIIDENMFCKLSAIIPQQAFQNKKCGQVYDIRYIGED